MAVPARVEMDNLADLETLLKEFPSLKILKETKERKSKVKCLLSGHEMPCRLDAVESYVKSKKFRALETRQEIPEEYMVHLKMTNKPGRLFCELTKRLMNDEPKEIQRHVEGKRFQKYYRQWKDCKARGEPFVHPCTLNKRHGSRPKPSGEGREAGGDHSDSEDGEMGAATMFDDLSDLYPDGEFSVINQLSDEENDEAEPSGANSGKQQKNGRGQRQRNESKGKKANESKGKEANESKGKKANESKGKKANESKGKKAKRQEASESTSKRKEVEDHQGVPKKKLKTSS